MSDTVIDLSGLDTLFDFNRIAEAMLPEVQKAMEHARGQIQRLLPDGATGNLRRAPKAMAEIVPGLGVEGRVDVSEQAGNRGASPATYWQFVENGRAPGKFPPWSKPTDALFLWAQRKMNNSRAEQKQKRLSIKKRKEGDKVVLTKSERQIQSFAFLVARKIALHGTKAQHPFERGWKASEKRVQTIIEYGFQKAMLQS